MTKIHICTLHAKPYTVCPDCGGEYCEKTWKVCPRIDWHPSHGTTAVDIARRYTALDDARKLSAANRAAQDAAKLASRKTPLERFMESR